MSQVSLLLVLGVSEASEVQSLFGDAAAARFAESSAQIVGARLKPLGNIVGICMMG